MVLIQYCITKHEKGRYIVMIVDEFGMTTYYKNKSKWDESILKNWSALKSAIFFTEK